MGEAARLTDRIRDGQRLVGTVIGVPNGPLAELTAAPFDFVWLDLEHSPLSIGAVHELTLAVQASGCACFVRLPCAEFERLTAILDCGVDGIVAPRVERMEEARSLVARLVYPPGGTRGFAFRRTTAWGRRSRPANDPECLVQIESRAALDAVDAIASVDGVDALVVGTADLALDLGVPLELDDKAMGDAMRRVREASERAGIGFGIAAGGPSAAIAAQLGASGGIVVYAADVRIFAAAVDRVATDCRAALAVARPG